MGHDGSVDLEPYRVSYAPDPGGGHRLHTPQVFTVTGSVVAANVVFADPRVFAAFGLPEHIESGRAIESRRAR